jgi:hypothetical protein
VVAPQLLQQDESVARSSPQDELPVLESSDADEAIDADSSPQGTVGHLPNSADALLVEAPSAQVGDDTSPYINELAAHPSSTETKAGTLSGSGRDGPSCSDFTPGAAAHDEVHTATSQTNSGFLNTQASTVVSESSAAPGSLQQADGGPEVHVPVEDMCAQPGMPPFQANL